jgi:CheY-like chemotaxis protein
MAKRLLVIEDNATTREFLTYLLKSFGYEVISAEDGVQGVEMAIKHLPDAIVCDVHLPRLDGFGVLRELKANPLTAKIPLIAVTALAMVGDRQRMLAAGFDGYVPKPVDPERFVPDILHYIPKSPSSQEKKP